MELDEYDLRYGLRYVVGKWQVDFVVSAFSNDLARIPAKEFKSEDGSDFSGITYEFFEDHTLIMSNASNGKTTAGTWEQTGSCEYTYTIGDFLDIPQSDFLKSAQTLTIQDGFLVFGLGCLAIGLKKISDGVVTEKPDIGDIAPSEEDLAQTGIVGRYAVYKLMSMVGENFGLYTKEEVLADLKARGESEEEIAETMSMFETIVEFTPEHTVIQWAKLPAEVSEAEINAALEEGEIAEVRDGYYYNGTLEWKCLGGKYYYDTREEREIMGEKQSTWDEITINEDGTIPFGSGFMVLKKI